MNDICLSLYFPNAAAFSRNKDGLRLPEKKKKKKKIKEKKEKRKT